MAPIPTITLEPGAPAPASMTDQLLSEILAQLEILNATDTYIDFLANPKWSWLSIVKAGLTIPAGTAVAPTSQVVYQNLDIAGYVYYVKVASSSPLLAFLFDISVRGGHFVIPLEFGALNSQGFSEGSFVRLLKYDTTNGVYVAEVFGKFPGIPLDGSLTITAENSDTANVTFSVETIIYKLLTG